MRAKVGLGLWSPARMRLGAVAEQPRLLSARPPAGAAVDGAAPTLRSPWWRSIGAFARAARLPPCHPYLQVPPIATSADQAFTRERPPCP
jgi:hypothetical protein